MSDELFSIGTAAKLCGVSTRTLRLYADCGLIVPKKIDEETGYRYYDEATLECISIIKYYKQLGFGLNEIKNLIESSVCLEHYDSLLERMKVLKKKQVVIYNSYVASKDWAKLIHEGSMAACQKEPSVNMKYYPADNSYCSLEQSYSYNFRQSCINLAWTQHLEKMDWEITGPIILKFDSWREKIAGKAERATILQECLQALEYPEKMIVYGGFMGLSCYHLGDLEGIEQTYERMREYADSHHYKIHDESYERYVIDYWTTSSTNKFVTEIIIPISSPDMNE
ncbi:MerR family transcriptional regulator [Lactovum odontotermitis]